MGWTTGQSRFDPRQRRKDFSCSLCDQTGFGVHPASCTMDTGGPFNGVKARPEHHADHSPHLASNLRMSRSYTSSPPMRPRGVWWNSFLKIHRSRPGLNPRTLGLIASMITITQLRTTRRLATLSINLPDSLLVKYLGNTLKQVVANKDDRGMETKEDGSTRSASPIC
jgi:hypothetical protein